MPTDAEIIATHKAQAAAMTDFLARERAMTADERLAEDAQQFGMRHTAAGWIGCVAVCVAAVLAVMWAVRVAI